MKSLFHKHLTAAIAGLGLCAACSLVEPGDLGDLDEARQRWADTGSANYQYSFQRSCFCVDTQPVRITVVNGSITEVLNLDTNEMVDSSRFQFYFTIDDFFDCIQESLDRGADEFTAMYDEVFGYPLDVDIDFIKQAVDDEMYLRGWDLSLN